MSDELPLPEDKRENCGNCRFGGVAIGDPDPDGPPEEIIDAAEPILECRRFPPQFVYTGGEGFMIGHPAVASDSWCGEFVHRGTG